MTSIDNNSVTFNPGQADQSVYDGIVYYMRQHPSISGFRVTALAPAAGTSDMSVYAGIKADADLLYGMVRLGHIGGRQVRIDVADD